MELQGCALLPLLYEHVASVNTKELNNFQCNIIIFLYIFIVESDSFSEMFSYS